MEIFLFKGSPITPVDLGDQNIRSWPFTLQGIVTQNSGGHHRLTDWITEQVRPAKNTTQIKVGKFQTDNNTKIETDCKKTGKCNQIFCVILTVICWGQTIGSALHKEFAMKCKKSTTLANCQTLENFCSVLHNFEKKISSFFKFVALLPKY